MLRGGKVAAGGDVAKAAWFQKSFLYCRSHQYKDYLPVDSEIVVNY